MYFRYFSGKIQLKNLKQHFDWGARAPLDYVLELLGSNQCPKLIEIMKN